MKTVKLHGVPIKRFLAVGSLAAALGSLPVERAFAFDAQAWGPAVDPQGYFSIWSSKTAPKASATRSRPPSRRLTCAPLSCPSRRVR